MSREIFMKRESWSKDAYLDYKKGVPLNELCLRYHPDIEVVKRNIRIEIVGSNRLSALYRAMGKDFRAGKDVNYISRKYLYAYRTVASKLYKFNEEYKKKIEIANNHKQKLNPSLNPYVIVEKIENTDKYVPNTTFIEPRVVKNDRQTIYNKMRLEDFRQRFYFYRVTEVMEIPSCDLTVVYMKEGRLYENF